jgi:hypothetical protein|uniref:Uncharacterized protein n=1 Tax=viral metagenome TaxID=1070528 RepID=A0A6C0BHR8_9ZZZZ
MSAIEEIAIEIQALAAPAPAYHMRMKDLLAEQKANYMYCAHTNPEGLFELWHKHSHDRNALRQKHRDTRARAKAEKALLAPSKLEPNFWMDHPNHDGRRDTLTAVLESMEMPTDRVTDLMPIYAKWLLTAKKTHENGRPMNRWALMEAFATEGNF